MLVVTQRDYNQNIVVQRNAGTDLINVSGVTVNYLTENYVKHYTYW